MADVLMYYNDVMLCYGITANELKQAYTEKFEKIWIDGKFSFVEQFNTQKEQPPRLLLFQYPPSRKALFYAVYDISPMAIW